MIRYSREDKSMKRIKRAVLFFVCFSIMIFGSSLTVFAASGEMWFTDPSATVGGTVEIDIDFKADSAVSTLETKLTYDTTLLKFVSGEGATESGGTIQLLNTADGSSKEFSYSLKFQALAEGSAKVEISSIQATASNGTALQVVEGNSTVTIGPGDPSLINDKESTALSSGVQVTVNEKSYTILNDFSEALIPEGFTKTEMSFEGQTCQAVMQESSGRYAMYLESPEKEAEFFLYNVDDGAFSAFRQISISQDRYIILLNEAKKNSLPEYLEKTTLTIEGAEFPAWQNVEEMEYYVIYALNSDGKNGFYQYDTVDETYQRYTPEKAEKEEAAPTTFFGKLAEFLKDHLDKVLIGVWAVFLLMIILLIVMGVKLRHRNNELDDLYDEYGIDEEEEDTPLVVEKKRNQPSVRKRTDTAFLPKQEDEDDFYDFEDDEDEGYEEDDEEEEEIVVAPRKVRPKVSTQTQQKQRGHVEEDDAFKVDFIDLD